MGEFRKLTVELDAGAVATIDQVVAEGRFADAGAVLRYAMRLFADEEREDERSYQELVERIGIEELRRLIDEGFASGNPVEATDEFYESIKREGRERLARARAAE